MTKRLTLLVQLAGMALALASCGVTGLIPQKPTASAGQDKDAKVFISKNAPVIEEGVASWYGPNFHGKLTANGEIYDMYGLTAAHRTLPFNTIVRVENMGNGKSVDVRINDRGPFAKNRIIDLSRKAAEEIGMVGPGTAPVQLYLIEGDLENSQTKDLKVATYTVQLGSYATEERAYEKAAEINGARVEKVRLNSKTVYRVYYGTYTDKNMASRKQTELAQNGVSGYVKQIQN